MFAIANAMHSGYTVDKIWELTKIDKWFLTKLKGLSDFRNQMSSHTVDNITPTLFRQAKEQGFSDKQLAVFWSSNENHVRRARLEFNIMPFVKQIDTVAAEFPAFTNYLYLTYNAAEHDLDFNDQGTMVLGSGVYRIGSSVEFDWCSVRAIRTLRENGHKTVMVNVSILHYFPIPFPPHIPSAQSYAHHFESQQHSIESHCFSGPHFTSTLPFTHTHIIPHHNNT
jgi:carbamoyl-phosphate synthase/aspartate carbamoyltransferase